MTVKSTIRKPKQRPCTLYHYVFCFVFSWSEDEFNKIKFNEVDGKTNRVSFEGKYIISDKGLPQWVLD